MSQESRDVIADRYRIISELGTGHYGIVYRAHDINLQKDVALKMLNVGDTNPTSVLRFQKEARAAAKLKHSNIVTVLDFRLDEKNNFYLVLELIEGMSLRSFIAQRKQIPPEECLHLFLQVLNGLAHAHASGVIHRDLNPNNILIDFRNPDDPTAKIVDFGLAWLTDEDQRLTKEGVAVGTPEYMSPEQCHGQETDARADIYSFGCVMFDALTGRPPYHNDVMVNIIMSHINKVAPTISEVRPDIKFPPMLVDIVDKTLKRNPDERFQSADELAYALRSVQLDVETFPELFEEPVKELEDVKPPAVAPLSWLPKSVQIVFVAVILLAILVLLLFLRFSEEQSSATQSVPSAKEMQSTAQKVIVQNRSNETGAGLPTQMILSSMSGGEQDGSPLKLLSSNMIVKNGNLYDVTGSKDEDLAIVKGHDEIRLLRMKGAYNFGGAGLKHIEGMKLTSFEIARAGFTDDELVRFLPDIPTLDALSLELCDGVTGSCFDRLAKKVPNITCLDLNMTGLTDEGLKKVPSFHGLDTLILAHCYKLKGTTLGALKNLPRLAHLNLSDTKLDMANLEHLRGCKQLYTLILNDTSLKADDLKFLQQMNVQRLYLLKSNADDACLDVIAKAKSIRFISLEKCRKFTPAGLRKVGENLTGIDFSYQDVTDEMIDSFSTWKKLQVIKLAESTITREQLSRLMKNVPTLNSLIVNPNVLSPDDVQYLQALYPERKVAYPSR